MHRRLTVVGLTADREGGGGGGGRQRERRCRPLEAEVPTAGSARQANGSWEGGGVVTASYWLKLGQVGFELEWGP